ncbi:MAG: molybdate ABC transporter permease subunit [Chloroflexi bacterium]|nr:molybdate ABC transporter permease subunit [Chloroflexota bacterium]
MTRKDTRSVSVGWLVAPGLLLTLLLGLPVLALVVEGLAASLPGTLMDAQALTALRVSLATTSVSTAAAILTGTPLAYVLARVPFRGKGWVEILVDLPIVLPPSVAGLGLLLAFGRRGLVGGSLELLGIHLPFTAAAVVLAQLFVAGPLFVRAARIGFGAVNRQLEEAATTEGANQWQLFRYVMIPAASQALLGGALLCWARALGEFGATIIFAGNLVGRTQTMPLAIYIGLENNRGVAVGLSVLLLGVSALFLGLLRRLERNWQVV